MPLHSQEMLSLTCKWTDKDHKFTTPTNAKSCCDKIQTILNAASIDNSSFIRVRNAALACAVDKAWKLAANEIGSCQDMTVSLNDYKESRATGNDNDPWDEDNDGIYVPVSGTGDAIHLVVWSSREDPKPKVDKVES